ncbi:MAG: hypothetical protein S4CHLAM6_03540 [Chlamydiae bacterium]|nr:hypothetical protein [Chlamydiota bacterium]
MNSTSYVDFYKKHNICPVLNNIDPLFLKKRAALYFQLGIFPSFLKDKTVLEFGPGNGINSLYTNSLGPKEYVLVDANPTSLENCKKNFQDSFDEHDNYSFVNSLVDDFQTNKKFDLVICEGLIPHQHDPKSCAKHAASFTKTGGLFVLTCHDFLSFLSEKLRCFISYISVDKDWNFDQKVDQITAQLSSHFKILKSMNRKQRDWVIDNTMQVEHWTETPLFSVHDAIEALDESFIPVGSSPKFINDLRWYKDLTDDNDFLFNKHALEKYWKNVHNLIDFRFEFPERSARANKELYQMSINIKKLISNYLAEPSNSNGEAIIALLYEIKRSVEEFSEETARAIQCYIDNLSRVFNQQPTNFTHFQNWWGRGMQFLSLLKVD